MIEFVRNRKKCRISKLFDLLFRGVRVNYVIYGNSQQLSDRQRKDWSVVAGYALPLKPLLHYGLRNASDHRRTVSTHVPRFIHPRISRRSVSADSPQTQRYISQRKHTLKIIFVRVNSNFTIRAGSHYRRASFQILTLIISPFHFGNERLISVMARSSSQRRSFKSSTFTR